jgi:hypothetical protein
MPFEEEKKFTRYLQIIYVTVQIFCISHFSRNVTWTNEISLKLLMLIPKQETAWKSAEEFQRGMEE